MKFRILLLCLSLAGPLRSPAESSQFGPLITLNNGSVIVEVSPRTGRLLSFHRPGEANWLAVRDEAPQPGWNWNPWGGDRIWPSSQSLNPQIYGNHGFDPVIDGKPWELIAKTPTSLELRSGLSPQLGLRITRRIELVGKTTRVLHSYRVERSTQSPFPVHVWAVTGVGKGDYMLMESDPRIPHEGGGPCKIWTGRDYPAAPDASLLPGTRILQFRHLSSKASAKAGTYGRWIALVDGNSAFRQRIGYDPEQFHMDACNLQAFTSKGHDVYEQETLSPSWFPAPGETRQWTVHWELIDFPKTAQTVEARADFLKMPDDAPAAQANQKP